MPQVTFDRQQATARKLKEPLEIATWNVRTLLQKGKLDNIKQEMERLKINVLGKQLERVNFTIQEAKNTRSRHHT